MQCNDFAQDVLRQIQGISPNYTQHQNRIIVNNTLTIILFSYKQLVLQNNITETYRTTDTLCIYEDEWHTKKHILLNRIHSLLGYNTCLPARLCTCVSSSANVALPFLQHNHLLGALNTMYYYALIHRNQVVAVAAFSHGRPMRRLPQGALSYELVAYTSLTDLTIVGGLSKLLNAFIHDHKPGDIMTYVDASFTNVYSNAFTQLGFTLHSLTAPITFILNTTTHARNKYKKGKSLLANEVIYTNNGNAKLVLTMKVCCC
jgi:hypothetical protein